MTGASLLPRPKPAALRALSSDRPTLAHQLRDALHAGDTDSARLLLALGAPLAGDVARRIPPALVCAVHAKMLDRDFVRELIAAGADVHGPEDEPDGNTLLHLAVMHRPEVVPILLEKGANPNRTNKRGETPLLLAVRGGDLHAMKDLLSWGADPHLKAGAAPSAFEQAQRQALSHNRGSAVLDYLELSMDRRRRNLPPTHPAPSLGEALADATPATTMAERLARRRAAAAAPSRESAHDPVTPEDRARERRHSMAA